MKKDRTRELILEQLKKIPIISVACEKVGISRASVHRWRKVDATFLRESEDAIREGIGYINDLGENQLLSLIGEKRMQAISFWLKHNHPRYGSKVKPYTPIATHEDLTPEEQKIILDALALASGEVNQLNDNDDNHPTPSERDMGKSAS